MRKFLIITCLVGNAIYAQNANTGFNTTTPKATVDIEGTLRLSEKVRDNTPAILKGTHKPILVDTSNGQLCYAPDGISKVAGGFRPGQPNQVVTLTKVPLDNTMVRVNFICHVDNSNETNNGETAAYTYGSFMLIGTNATNPTKIIDATIKGYNGLARTDVIVTDDSIQWNNGSQNGTEINIDQSTGELTIKNGAFTMSYFFEFMGGI